MVDREIETLQVRIEGLLEKLKGLANLLRLTQRTTQPLHSRTVSRSVSLTWQT